MFNYERPHEGLNNLTPGSLYRPSSKVLPRTPIEYVYPTGFLKRRVNNRGDIKIQDDFSVPIMFDRVSLLLVDHCDHDLALNCRSLSLRSSSDRDLFPQRFSAAVRPRRRGQRILVENQ